MHCLPRKSIETNELTRNVMKSFEQTFEMIWKNEKNKYFDFDEYFLHLFTNVIHENLFNEK